MRGSWWEHADEGTPLDHVAQQDDRIIAASSAWRSTFEPELLTQQLPIWTDLCALDRQESGATLVGAGMWFDPDASLQQRAQVHRLSRQLTAARDACRWCIVAVAIPIQRSPAEMRYFVDQARAGAIELPQLQVPLRLHYWPFALLDGDHQAVLCAWRNSVL